MVVCQGASLPKNSPSVCLQIGAAALDFSYLLLVHILLQSVRLALLCRLCFKSMETYSWLGAETHLWRQSKVLAWVWISLVNLHIFHSDTKTCDALSRNPVANMSRGSRWKKFEKQFSELSIKIDRSSWHKVWACSKVWLLQNFA